MFRKKKKLTVFNIQCKADKSHMFDREFIIFEGTEEKYTTEVQIYCPFCDHLLTLEIKGKIASDTAIFRSVERV